MATLNQIIDHFKSDIRINSVLAFFIFLYILFFQPFPIEHFDFNSSLLFIAGLVLIVFILMIALRLIAQSKLTVSSAYNLIGIYLLSAIFIITNSVALAFYIKFVGGTDVSFHIMAKIILISLLIPFLWSLYDRIRIFENKISVLNFEKGKLQEKINAFTAIKEEEEVSILSDNGKEKISLLLKDLAIIRSADNYVELVFLKNDKFQKKLIRATLKNIEYQLKSFKSLIRAHRKTIVNSSFIESLHSKYNNHYLSIVGFDEDVPVSRQYLLSIRNITETWGE